MYAHTWNNDSPAMREKKKNSLQMKELTNWRGETQITSGRHQAKSLWRRATLALRRPTSLMRPAQRWRGGVSWMTTSNGWHVWKPMNISRRIFQVKIHNSWKSPRVQWKTVSAEGWKSVLKHTFSQLIYLSICWVASKNQHRLHLGCSLCGCSWRTPREM